MPTIAAGYRINQLFDVGLGFQLVVGEFQLINAAATPAQATTCGAAGDAPNCDSYGQVVTHSLSPAFLLSGMAHPKKWLDVGLTLRPQVDINSSGFITPAATSTDGVSSVQLDRFPATFSIKLPTIVRAGARIVARDPDGFERGDIELDATWENWSVEQEAIVHSEMHPLAGTFDVRVPHHYKDVVSFRLGGAYNHPLADRKHVTLRAGAYYESPTTDVRDTHLDAFTTDKVGLTAGVGLRLGAVTFNIAYAGVFMPSRNVTDGTLRAASSTNGTTWAPTDPDISHVNNGRYESTLHIVAAGMTIHFNEAH
jgi:long-subunit fatty acid transport protein